MNRPVAFSRQAAIKPATYASGASKGNSHVAHNRPASSTRLICARSGALPSRKRTATLTSVAVHRRGGCPGAHPCSMIKDVIMREIRRAREGAAYWSFRIRSDQRSARRERLTRYVTTFHDKRAFITSKIAGYASNGCSRPLIPADAEASIIVVRRRAYPGTRSSCGHRS